MRRSLLSRRRWLEFSLSALLVACWLAPVSAQINLSDIVAGGTGEGLGWTSDDDVEFGGEKYAAVNLANGTFMTRSETDLFHNGTTDTDGINPSPVEGAIFEFPRDFDEVAEIVTLYSPYFRESPIPRRIFLRRHITAWIIEELMSDFLRSGDAHAVYSTDQSSLLRMNG